MKVKFQDVFADSRVVNMESIPRVGDSVSWKYIPAPIVSKVFWSLGDNKEYDVLIYLK